MEIKQKHRKHALRKAVTAAVLAGTAFSSLGGFAGAVTTVKADEPSFTIKNKEEYEKLINLIAEGRLNHEYGGRFSSKSEEQIIDELKKLLSEFSVDTLKTLVSGFDEGSIAYPYSVLQSLNTQLSTMSPQHGDFMHKILSLKTLVVGEIYRRIESEKKLSEDINEKEKELKDLDGKAKSLEDYKKKLESIILKK